MTRILVWDLPTRLFHWVLAGTFAGAFLIATTSSDEGPLFPVHMLLGLVMAFAVALRLVWGLVGSRWSRFASFDLRPSALVAYLRGAGKRSIGHNPAASWSAAVMLGCAVGLAATGIAMARGWGEVEEVHELLAWTFAGAVAVHLAGLALHTLRHREPIARSMVDGRKEGRPAWALASARPLVGLVFLALTAGWAGGLARSYDPATQAVTLPVLGTRLALGEAGEAGEDE